MTERSEAAAPALKARIAGSLWLIVIVTGGFALGATSRLIVRDDAAATANNVLANESLLRLSIVSDLIAAVCYVGVTVLLYELLKPVSRSLSLLAAFFGLGGVAIGGILHLSRVPPLLLLEGDRYLGVFTTSQLQATMLMSLNLYASALYICLVLFGVQCFIIGYLIVRSTFLPWILGVLLAVGGLAYVIGSFANFLSPSFGAVLSPFVSLAALLGEGSVTLWLLILGVNVPRWAEEASSLTRQ